jgi:hypothetical protein
MRESKVVKASDFQCQVSILDGFNPDRHPPTKGSLRGGRDESVLNTVHCKKKVSDFPVPSRDFPYQTLPAGDGKIGDLFLSVQRKYIKIL